MIRSSKIRNLALATVLVAGAGCSGTEPTPASEDVGTRFPAVVTAYTYYSNTPPGSTRVSHPVIHETAGGVGTHADPITMAVGHSLASGTRVMDYPAGTRFYMPHLRRYFIVEDVCGDGPEPEKGPCHTGFEPPAEAWVDIWVDGQGMGEEEATRCAETAAGLHEIVRDPSPDEEVESGHICD